MYVLRRSACLLSLFLFEGGVGVRVGAGETKCVFIHKHDNDYVVFA